MSAEDDKYWAEYDGLQDAKHQLLRSYLGGWFPILSSWSGRVLYIDCHAGRGRHETGHEGSPILALRLLLEHKLRTRILSSTEVHFYLFENNQLNYNNLCTELAGFGTLPGNILIHPHQEDYEAHLHSAIKELSENNQQLAPSFVFLDPYGFSISMDFLNRLLEFPTCELLINFMYRYIDMAIHNSVQSENMDALFGCGDWRSLLEIDTPDRRAQETIALFSRQLATKYVTHLNMFGENNSLKYVLIHATNHERGKELMKHVIWTVAPDGTFSAHERDDPNQLVLIVPKPDLRKFQENLRTTFAGKKIQMSTLYKWLLPQVYLPQHLHQVLRGLRDDGFVQFNNYEGRFAFKKDPIVVFAPLSS